VLKIWTGLHPSSAHEGKSIAPRSTNSRLPEAPALRWRFFSPYSATAEWRVALRSSTSRALCLLPETLSVFRYSSLLQTPG